MFAPSTVAAESPLAHGRNRVTHSLLTGLNLVEVLDYGCGNGRFAAAMAEADLVVHACDVDLDMVNGLADRSRQVIDFFVVPESAASLPLRDGQLSAVTCCDVLEHMPEASRLASLQEMKRVLHGDGVLIVTVPHRGLFAGIDPENAKFRFPRLHRWLFKLMRGRAKYAQRYGGTRFGNFSTGMQRHHHFTVRELTELLGNAGFQVETVRFFTLFYPLVHSLLWTAEALQARLGWDWPVAVSRALYTWDSDLEPGELGYSVAVRARPVS